MFYYCFLNTHYSRTRILCGRKVERRHSVRVDPLPLVVKRGNTVPLHSATVPFCRFDGEEIKTDETIRTLAQKWQPARRARSEERSTKAVDTDMIVVPCVVSMCSR